MNTLIKYIGDLKEKKTLVQISAAIVILFAAGLFLFFNGDRDSITVEKADGKSSREEASEKPASELYVDIGGEVKRPGVYVVSPSTRIYEVISKAGGVTSKADTTNINQAEVVKDGQKIVIPGKGKASQDEVPDAYSQDDSLVNINSATKDELMELNGIGESRADDIIRYREENGGFSSKEDLKNVSGIGDKIYAKLESSITA